MKFFEWIRSGFSKTEFRGRVDDPNLWLANVPFINTRAGIPVTPDVAMTLSTVFACVDILSNTIASMPLLFYKRIGEGKELAPKHNLYPLLHDMPNPMQSSFQFRKQIMVNILLRGNGYAWKEMNDYGEILALYPLMSKNMDVVREKGEIWYQYTDEDGKFYRFPPEYIWHITDLVTDGLKGLSRITLAREGLGLTLGAESYGGQFFGNNAVAGSVIRHPMKLSPDSRKNLKDSVVEFQASKRFQTMILEEGMSYDRIALSNEDAQYLQTRTFQTKEIARWFNMPLVLLGEADKSSTYASAEQFFMAYSQHTVMPWCVNWEQSIYKDLITEKDRKKYFAEFLMDALLRGDTLSRYNAHKIGREWGWLSANDVRRKENLNPIENGDIYLQPMNMVEAGTKPPEPEPLKPGDDKGEQDDEGDQDDPPEKGGDDNDSGD